MNITLIGMAGAGKSFFGRRIAPKLGFEFVDVDEEMERAFGSPLRELIDSLGEEGFLAREGEQSIVLTSGRDNLVVSPGGSIIYHPPAMEHLSAISRVVYLDVPFEIIEARILRKPRAIVGGGDKSLREIYEERLPLYKKYAHVSIDAASEDAAAIEELILRECVVL